MHGPSWSKLDDDDDILKGVGAAEGDGQILLPRKISGTRRYSPVLVAFPAWQGLQGRRESTARKSRNLRNMHYIESCCYGSSVRLLALLSCSHSAQVPRLRRVLS